MKPISPKQAQKDKNHKIPEGVIQAFNELIAENFVGDSALFTLDEVASRAVRYSGLTRNELFGKRYFDVEALFEAEGWEVEFDKADPGEHDSWFTFRKK